MSADSYHEAIRRLLASEGGYVNHPSDPGGPTNFGITLADYRRYVKPAAGAADVRAMTVDEAKAIYRAKYWGAMRCDALPAGVDYCVFDYAVNSGTGRAPKVLQRVLGQSVTGRMDDATVAAAKSRDARELVQAICDERMRFLKGLRTWPVFGKGWNRRVAEVRAASLAMADRAAGRIPGEVPRRAQPAKARCRSIRMPATARPAALSRPAAPPRSRRPRAARTGSSSRSSWSSRSPSRRASGPSGTGGRSAAKRP